MKKKNSGVKKPKPKRSKPRRAPARSAQSLPAPEPRPEIDQDAVDELGLTPRQMLFVAALMGPAGFNATKAARLAGYKDSGTNAISVTAHDTLSSTKVQEAIRQRMAARVGSAAWSKNIVADMASANMVNFLDIDEKGNSKLNLAKALALGAMGQIKEYREEEATLGESGIIIKRTLKLHDAQAAATTLMKHHSMLVEQHQVSGNLVVNKVAPDEEIIRLCRELGVPLPPGVVLPKEEEK